MKTILLGILIFMSCKDVFSCTPVRGGDYRRFTGCEPMIPGPRGAFPGFPGMPRYPGKVIPLPIPGDFQQKEPVFAHLEANTGYTVKLTSKNPNPPSCKVVAGRLKNHLAKISAMESYAKKIERGNLLSFEDVRELERLSREYLPSVLDEIDQTIHLEVTWQFLTVPVYRDRIFYFVAYGNSNFNQFFVKGPGLRWEKGEEALPEFFAIDTTKNVVLTYDMQMLDFCFAENNVKIRGRLKHEFSPQDPVLFAEWKREIKDQQGFYVIKTVRDFLEDWRIQ